MDNKRSLESYFRKKLSFLFFIIFIFLFIYFLMIIIDSYYSLKKQKEIFFNYVLENSINNLNKKLTGIEVSLDLKIEKQLKIIYNNYNKLEDKVYLNSLIDSMRKDLVILLKTINDEININRFNYYFITKEGIIYDTDYVTDLGFDISKSNIWDKIKNLKKGQIYISTLGREKKTGIPRLYAYVRLSDNRIFELGVSFLNFDKIIIDELNKVRMKNVEIKNIYISSFLNSKLDNNKKNFAKIEKELLIRSERYGKIVGKRVSITETNYYYVAYSKFGNRYIRLTIYSKCLIHTVKKIFLLFIFFILIFLILNYIIKKFAFEISKWVSNLANLFPQFKFDSEEIEKLENFKKSNILELDKIYDNYVVLVKEIIEKHNTLLSEKELANKLYQEAKDNLSLFEKLSKVIPASILIYKSGEILFVSEYTKILFEISEKKINKEDLLYYIENDYKEIFNQTINKTFDDKEFKSGKIIQIVTKKGKQKWVKFISLKIKEEKEPSFLLIFFDINDLKQKELELLQSYEKIRKFNDDIFKITKLTGKVISNLDLSLKDTLKQAFRTIFNIVDEADYGSLQILMKDKAYFIDAIGHDLNILKNIMFSEEELLILDPDKIHIIENITNFSERINRDKKRLDLLQKASKPIKYTLVLFLKSESGVTGAINLDIASESGKKFSERSINIAKFFKDLLTLYLQVIENSEKLKLILYSISDGIIVTNTKNNIILSNRKLLELFNLKEEKIRFKNIKYLLKKLNIDSIYKKLVNNDYGEKVKIENIDDFLNDFEGEYEFYILDSNKKRKIYFFNKNCYYDENGILLGNVITIKDITKEIELNRQLIQSQKLETVGQLTGGISHDFNNMLGAILGSSELIKLNLQKLNFTKSDQKESLEYVEMIINKTLQGKNFIRKLLDFSKTSEIQQNIIDLHELLIGVVEITKRSIRKTTKLNLKLNAKKFCIKGDRALIENVFLNMILNSDQAIEKKNGKIEIETENVNLEKGEIENTVIYENNKNYIKIIISDNGKGIKKEYLNKIFDPFFTTKEKGKGTGLGLSMVYQTIKNHNGYIKVESALGKGTTFFIYLPIVEENIEKEKEKKGNNGLKINIEKKFDGEVLVVDDEKEIRDVLKSILEKMGFTVLVANNGVKATKIFKEKIKNKEKIEFVLLDLLMPEMDGKETFYILKQIDPDVKVIISSGYSGMINLQELLNDGVKEILFKPYKIEEIINKIQKIVQVKN